MKPSLVKQFFKIMILSTLSSCSGYQYVASPRYLPLNEKKGELTACVFPSSLQAGYSFSNHFSVFATGYRRFETIRTIQPLASKKNRRSGNATEVNVGASYFGRTRNIIYEVLLGAGKGEMDFANDYEEDKHSEALYEFKMHAKTMNMFLQPNIGYRFSKEKISKHFTFGAFAKINAIRYENIVTDGFFGRGADPDPGINYFMNRSQADLFFVQPGIFAKGGFRNFKALVQFSPPINASGFDMRYNRISLNIGITMKLGLLEKPS